MRGMNTRFGMKQRVWAMALCTMAVLGMAGCGSASSSPGERSSIDPMNSYAADFRREYEEATSPLVKGILKDGKITDAEMQEFASVFAQCMTDKGLAWSWSKEEGEQIIIPKEDVSVMTGERVTALEHECQDETDYMHIKPLYDYVTRNPENLGHDEIGKAVLSCMKDRGLIDRSMDPDYFLSFYYGVDVQDLPEYQQYIAPFEDESNPAFDMDRSVEYFQCVDDPLDVKN